MTAKLLKLRPLPQAQAEIRRRIGQGLVLDFQLADRQGTLTLYQASEKAAGNGVTFATDLGPLRLYQASPLLSLLATCPALLDDNDTVEPDEGHWYWPFYNQCLSPRLHQLFGQLVPRRLELDDGLPCVFEAQLDGQTVRSDALLPLDTARRLLAQPGWRPLTNITGPGWRLSPPLLLGRTALTMGQLRSLRPGDIVLPQQTYFQPDGTGHLVLGRLRLHGQLDNHPNPHFVITDLEEIPMNAYASEFTPDLTVPGLSPEMALEDDHDSGATFDDLPLSLTLNCGRLSLTLGELRTLGAGSVLTLTQGTPGLAMLCHDDRPLAHGELVDVDGHIGLQITRLELGR